MTSASIIPLELLPSYEEAIQDAAKARLLFDASKGGNVPGITEDHRFELSRVFSAADVINLSPVGRSAGESGAGGALVETSRVAGSVFLFIDDFSEPLEVF